MDYNFDLIEYEKEDFYNRVFHKARLMIRNTPDLIAVYKNLDNVDDCKSVLLDLIDQVQETKVFVKQKELFGIDLCKNGLTLKDLLELTLKATHDAAESFSTDEILFLDSF